MSDRVADYRGLVESIANRYRPRHILAEFDDLVQEGLVAVWDALERGVEPGPEYILNRMRSYVRKLNRAGREPEEPNLSYSDSVGKDPSAYSDRERLARAGTGLDEAELQAG